MFSTVLFTVAKMWEKPKFLSINTEFANEVTDMGLISKTYKQLMQLTIKNTNNPGLPGGPVVKTLCFHHRGQARVQSLVRELRSHMPRGGEKKKKYLKKKKKQTAQAKNGQKI